MQDVNTDSENAAVVKAVLYLGRSFGMDVIAKGVETEAQLDFLKQYNCRLGRGTFFERQFQ